MAKLSLTVGELSKRSGVSVSALHFYERKGLIHSSRNGANHRIYSPIILRKIAIINVAQKLGISLKEVKQAMDFLPKDDKISVKDWQKLSSHWQDMLNEKIRQMSFLKNEMDHCIGCGCLSLDHCNLVNHDDAIAEKGAGARYLEHEDSPLSS